MSDDVVALHDTPHLAADDGPLARARLRLRLVLGAGHKLGPGKIDLLEAIAATGSITAAGRSMGMSYRRAWLLIDETNRMFDTPLVTTLAGGTGGGGARLTDLGRSVVAAFRRVEARTRAAIHDELGPLEPRFADLDAPLPDR